MNSEETTKWLRAEFAARRLARTDERELQDAIEQMLSEHSLTFSREYRLSERDRPDFFLNGVALEVKMAGSAPQVMRQLWRYAESPEVERIVLVTTRSQLRTMPDAMMLKPVEVIYLSHL